MRGTLSSSFARVRKRLSTAVGTLLSREIAVLTNAIAFNFLLCLFPLLLVLAGTAQQLPGGRRAGSALLLLLDELIPFGHEAMAESMRKLSRTARGLEAVSLLVIVWGSSGIFMPVEMALNRAWGGDVPHRSFIKSRGLAFLMTVTGGIIALLSIALTIAARSYRQQWPTVAASGAKLSAFLLSFLLFFVIYRFVASGVATVVALRAALLAGTAWEAVKYAFVVNLGRSNLEAFYGPLAFSVSLILWAYVSSLVLVFGALMVPRQPRRRRQRGGGTAKVE
jgi:membrane protein